MNESEGKIWGTTTIGVSAFLKFSQKIAFFFFIYVVLLPLVSGPALLLRVLHLSVLYCFCILWGNLCLMCLKIFRTVRQMAQEQFFLMATRCCMGHRPLLFFITLLFTVLGVRHCTRIIKMLIYSLMFYNTGVQPSGLASWIREWSYAIGQIQPRSNPFVPADSDTWSHVIWPTGFPWV